MVNLIKDIKSSVIFFTDMRDARKKGKEIIVEKKVQLPFVMSGGFYDTVEGCTLSWLDCEIKDKAREAFLGLPYEEKRRLYFSPKDGEFVERAKFWRDMLKPVMTEKQCHIAMCQIIHWYIHIKHMREETSRENAGSMKGGATE